MTTIRKVEKSDVAQLKVVLDSIELFPSELLDEMIADYFENPASEDLWFTAIQDNQAVGVGYCAPEKLTEGTYNLYAIGVLNAVQGNGIGSEMMDYIEKDLKSKGHRILIVDTSGSDEFRLTRRFYEKLRYTQEAVIRDFWNEGDDKVIFWKRLNA